MKNRKPYRSRILGVRQMSNYKLLGVGTNAKTIKGDGDEYLTAILYMHSWKIMVDGNMFNSCSMATLAGCVEGMPYQCRTWCIQQRTRGT